MLVGTEEVAYPVIVYHLVHLLVAFLFLDTLLCEAASRNRLMS